MAKKKIYFGTNTKMYKTIKDTVEFVSQLQELTKDISREDMQLFVIPSYTTLRDANEAKDEGLMPEVKEHEPRLALDGEADGLSFYREIINEAPDYLNPDGRIYFEIGAEQGEDLTHLMNERGFSEVKVHKDLAGLDRIVTGIYSRK